MSHTDKKISKTEEKKGGHIILVTGGNRGIGLEIVNSLSKDKNNTVIFTCRSEDEGGKALKAFKKAGKNNVVYLRLDLNDEKSIDALIKNVLKEYHHVDILVNNAGIFSDGTPTGPVSGLSTSITEVYNQFTVNTVGPLRLTIGFLPQMKERNFGRIVNVASIMGSLAGMTADSVPMYGPSLGYRISKTALNTVTRVFAAEVKDKNILINSMCPGFVKTDMTGGANSPATRTPEEGADTAVWLATIDDKGPRGGFFSERKQYDW